MTKNGKNLHYGSGHNFWTGANCGEYDSFSESRKIGLYNILSTKTFEILGFIEDRKKTLIDIKQNSETSHIPCFLADWGYLKELDRYNLSDEIKLLKLGSLQELVAIWR